MGKGAAAEEGGGDGEMMIAAQDGGDRRARVVMPGYTHLQPAQPILFAHYLLAYFEMFRRDFSRLEACRARADQLPMGAGALAGSTLCGDRARAARGRGFSPGSRRQLCRAFAERHRGTHRQPVRFRRR